MLFKRARPQLNDNQPEPALAPESISRIGRDAQIDGGFQTAGDVHVEGKVTGALRARRCVVEADGLIEGEVAADEVVVRGTIRGPVRAYHVHLEASAVVEGDVINDGITIDHGAELTGSVWRSENPFEEPRAGRAAAAPESLTRAPLWPADGYRPITAAKLR